MKTNAKIVLMIALGLNGCASYSTVDSLREERKSLSYYQYVGSSKSYHFIKLREPFATQLYKLDKSELEVANEFPKGEGSKVYHYIDSENRLSNDIPVVIRER